MFPNDERIDLEGKPYSTKPNLSITEAAQYKTKEPALCKPHWNGDFCLDCGKNQTEVNLQGGCNGLLKVGYMSPKDTATSDGSSAHYYELPPNAKELQDIISAQNMNSQMGEIGRAWKRYGMCSHSDKLRDIRKIQYYAKAEEERLLKYGE